MTSVTMKYTSPSPHQISKPPMKSTKQWDVSVTKTKRWEFTSSVTPTATGWKLFQKRCNYFFLINYSPNLTKKGTFSKRFLFSCLVFSKKQSGKCNHFPALSFAFDYSASGAPTGQTLAPSTTVDAFAWIDFVFVCSCRDSAYWALSFACTTADAIAFNFVSHTGLPPFYKFFLLQDNCKQNACRYPSHLYFNISQKKINQYCKIYCSELLSYPIFLHRLCEKVSISFLILQQDRHFR